MSWMGVGVPCAARAAGEVPEAAAEDLGLSWIGEEVTWAAAAATAGEVAAAPPADLFKSMGAEVASALAAVDFDPLLESCIDELFDDSEPLDESEPGRVSPLPETTVAAAAAFPAAAVAVAFSFFFVELSAPEPEPDSPPPNPHPVFPF